MKVKKIVAILIVCLALGGAYFYRSTLIESTETLVEAVWPAKPCSKPITYSLGKFDSRFGITKEQFLVALEESEEIWSSAIGRELFAYSTTSPTIDINLVYDYREEAVQKMKILGIAIENNKAGYESLKAKYDALSVSFDKDRSELEANMSAYEKAKTKYEEEVVYWNKQGGAPKDEYRRIQSELDSLNEWGAEINKNQKVLNEMVDSLNSMATILNKLVRDLNLNVKTYNAVGASTGEEFSEGEYVVDEDGRRINIYEWGDRTELVRILSHEFGHALGIEHVEDAGAIMYRLNQGKSLVLAPKDISALRNVCNIE